MVSSGFYISNISMQAGAGSGAEGSAVITVLSTYTRHNRLSYFIPPRAPRTGPNLNTAYIVGLTASVSPPGHFLRE